MTGPIRSLDEAMQRILDPGRAPPPAGPSARTGPNRYPLAGFPPDIEDALKR